MAHVLVVDDDRTIRGVIRSTLEDEGHVVVAEANGDHVVSFMQSSPRPLVILLDLVLGGDEPNAVLSAIEADPSLARTHRIVAMTAMTEREAEPMVASISASLGGLLMKPFDIDDLIGIVADAARDLAAGDDRG